MRRVIFFVSANKRTASSLSTNQYFHIIRSIELAIMAVLLLTMVSQVIGAESLVPPLPPPIPEPVPLPPPIPVPLPPLPPLPPPIPIPLPPLPPLPPPIPVPIPPLPPIIPPLIFETYWNDEDENRIQDAFELQPRGRQLWLIGADVIAMFDVQLTFSSPITQQQIDDFLGIGGEITYIYETISYGWRGRIPELMITLLPELMGPTLVIVEEPPTMVRNMDVATRTGRVRPIWKQNFAGNPLGFDGDRSITIGIIDSGIDASHPDLAGRQVYWEDFSGESYTNPIDTEQHGTHVAGIALGTGDSGGSATGTLYYTEIGNLEYIQENLISPQSLVHLNSATHTLISRAEWTSSVNTKLYHVSRPIDNLNGLWNAESYPVSGWSGLVLRSTISGSNSNLYASALLGTGGTLTDFVITNSVSAYPGIDSFNKFSGVAPGCRWAAAKDGPAWNDSFTTDDALDRLVLKRVELNVKIVNISSSITSNHGTSETFRQKTNSAVSKGVLVVVSAGNNGRKGNSLDREISDPGRAEMALTVGASNDENRLTDYSSQGFYPGLSSGVDYKPDLIAPGGSEYHTLIMSVDSGFVDGTAFDDKQPDDYRNAIGTSMASPFAAGCAALVIDAMQQKGIQWDFYSSYHPRFVKMVLCATATETCANRENGKFNPTLQRAANGPNGFPPGKDKYEGYGIINPDAAVEAVYLTYEWGTEETDTLGSGRYDRRAWARTVRLSAGLRYDINLDTYPIPILSDATELQAGPGGDDFGDEDFDLYLYSAEPSPTGTPEILAASTTDNVFSPQTGRRIVEESISYTATDDANALLVVKRISGSGGFKLNSSMRNTGPVSY